MNAIERIERDDEFDAAVLDARRMAHLVNTYAEELALTDEVLRSNIITLYAQFLFACAEE